MVRWIFPNRSSKYVYAVISCGLAPNAYQQLRISPGTVPARPPPHARRHRNANAAEGRHLQAVEERYDQQRAPRDDVKERDPDEEFA